MKAFVLIPGLLPVVILIIIGLLIKYKKAYWLISGYNTMSSDKKKNVDIEGLGRFASNVCFAFAGIILAALIAMVLGKTAVAGIIFALMLPTIIYTVVNAKKYDGNTRDSEGRMKTGTKVLIGVTISFLVLVGVGVGVLLHLGSKPAEYTLTNGTLSISGMYGRKIPIGEINSVELKESLPKVLYKSNGSSTGKMLKGYFKLEGVGDAELFTDVSKPPFIYLQKDSKLIIINCEDSAMTRELYEKLRSEL